jgi:integrase
MATKIGLRDVANLQPNQILWDSTVRGFCVRRQRSETITWSVFYRTKDNVQRWHKVGRFPVLTPHLARLEAIRILRAVALGEDPSAERQAQRNSMTVAQLADKYIEDLEAGRINGKKASTLMSDKSRIKNHIAPKIGKLKVLSITQEQCQEFMYSLSAGSAKRTIGLLGAIFSFAQKRKIRTDNPCHGLDKPKDVKRTRRLSDAEYRQLSAALANINDTAANVVTMLAITGWRSSEVKNLRWSELDIERKAAILGETKTGISIRPLSTAAIDLIRQCPQTSQFVFPHVRGKPIYNLTPHWNRLGMSSDVTPHVLRHSFASLAADLGLADHTIAGLLGHARQSITSRYMHLADKVLIEAADLVAGHTTRLMQGA